MILSGTASYLKAEVLYDGSLGTTPNLQGWRYQTFPLTNSGAAQSPTNGVTRLDTTAVTSSLAGYFSALPGLGSHPDVPVLDRTIGFRVTWDVLIHSETHDNPDRAGFSVIVISDDLKGLEIAFWEDEIWVQHDDVSNTFFTHGEGAMFDTTTALTRYELEVLDDSYDLLANGTSVLTGALRDYSSYTNPNPFLEIPYKSQSFLFLGDDTSSAAADIDLAFVSVIVPEPSTMAVVMLVGFTTAAGLRPSSRFLV